MTDSIAPDIIDLGNITVTTESPHNHSKKEEGSDMAAAYLHKLVTIEPPHARGQVW